MAKRRSIRLVVEIAGCRYAVEHQSQGNWDLDTRHLRHMLDAIEGMASADGYGGKPDVVAIHSGFARDEKEVEPVVRRRKK